MFTALLFKEVNSPTTSIACGAAPSLQTNGGLTVEDALEIELYGACMVTTIQALAANEQFAEAVRVANSVAAFLQRTGAGNATQLITQASTISCTAYGLALGHARDTTVTSMGILYNLIKPILFWETTVQQLGTTCSGWPADEYQTVINAKTAEAEAYYKLLKPNLTDTSSSNYTAAKTEVGQSAQAKNEVLALNPPPAVRSTVANDVSQRAQPVLLDAMLQAPWNSCNSINADYTELMNLMVTLNSPDSVKDASQYCGTLLQAQTKNLAGTVIDTLTPKLGGISASQKRTDGSIKAAKNAKLVLNGPIQAMKCPVGSASGETLTIKLDGTTLQSGLTAPYLSNPLEINIASALETAHPSATANLAQAILTLERTGSTCGDFWGTNPVPLLSLTLRFAGPPRLAFMTTPLIDPDHHADIWKVQAVDANGGSLATLLNGTIAGCSSCVGRPVSPLSWSSDGSQMVYQGYSPATGSFDIWTAKSDGSGATLVPNTSGATWPNWTPDGKKFVYGSPDGKVMSINIDGTGVLALSSGDDLEPRLSADGKRIIFTRRDVSGNTSIFVMNADGSGVSPVVIPRGFNTPALSPDGSQIAFLLGDNVSWKLMVANSDGSNQRAIYSISSQDIPPGESNPRVLQGPVSWSPEGNRVAFMLYQALIVGVPDNVTWNYICTTTSILMVNSDGSGLTEVMHGDRTVSYGLPSWSR
jgi:Tol biopolymer transport system component